MSELLILSDSDIARFWKKVDKTDGCWLWKASVDDSGYGRFGLLGKSRRSNRVAWVIANGQIPEGEGCHGTCVLHECDNPACVNPSHLFLGSNKDNSDDKVKKGRQARVRGSAGGLSKLSEQQVVDIKARIVQGESQTKIARQYGISNGLVTHIKKGRAWAHLKDSV